MQLSKMLFFLCFRPTIKFQDGSPVDPLFEPPADPLLDSTSQKLVLSSFRKILVPVKFVSAILGPEMGAPILWTPGKMRSACRKNHVRKIPLFWGGFGGGGGGEVPILFLWARGFF